MQSSDGHMQEENQKHSEIAPECSQKPEAKIPRGIFAISLFGFFLGMSTTMVYSQLSLFLKNDIGLSVADIASLDGTVESFSYFTRIFAGPVSDFFASRKALLVLGCAVTLIARFFLPMARGFGSILGIQLAERFGNGTQATPRDALIADITPRSIRGRVYGLTRSVKTTGALIGGLLAISVMSYCSDDFRAVFRVAVIPVVIALICLCFVKEHKRSDAIVGKRENPFKRKYLKSLDFSFWKLILLVLVFQLGHFTEHLFPIYMEKFVSTRVSCTTGIMVNLGQVCLAFTIGFLADRFGKGKFIRFCIMNTLFANICFLLAPYVANTFGFSLDLSRMFGEGFIITSPAICVYLGLFLWGGQLAAIESLFLSIVTEQAAFHLRATAIGIFSIIMGFGYWAASKAGGIIWDNCGSSYVFIYSMFFCLLSFFLTFILIPKKYNVNLEKNS